MSATNNLTELVPTSMTARRVMMHRRLSKCDAWKYGDYVQLTRTFAMNLFILRHGLAVEHGTPGYADDASRPLTVEGKAKLRKISRAMEKLDLDFDVIISSPYQRARQTAEITAKELDLEKKLAFSDALIPSGSAKELISHINRLKPRPENILLVGHEPY